MPVHHTIAVAGGKGGVGKSTVTLNLGRALRERGAAVGILDADLYGPDIPLMVGLTRTEEAKEWKLWRRGGLEIEPVERHGLKLMSAGFLLGERQTMPAQAQTLAFVIRQLVQDVSWGDLDWLLIDLPPGTADLHTELLRVVPLTGARILARSTRQSWKVSVRDASGI